MRRSSSSTPTARSFSLVRPDEIALYGRAFERLAALAVYGAEARAILAWTLDRLAAKRS